LRRCPAELDPELAVLGIRRPASRRARAWGAVRCVRRRDHSRLVPRIVDGRRRARAPRRLPGLRTAL